MPVTLDLLEKSKRIVSRASRERPAERRGTPAIGEAPRVPALDGLRGMAILAVLAFHFNLFRLVEPGNSMDRVASGLFSAGWCGVDLFFVLSGFLITTILYDAKEDPYYFRNFYVRRLLRIVPLYYAVLFLTFFVIPHLPSRLIPPEKLEKWARLDTSQIWYWLYLANVSTMLAGTWGHGILDVTWSLAIEEQFYLLWPLAVYTLNRNRLLQVCVLVFLTGFLIRFLMTMQAINPISVLVFTPGRFDVIAAGAFVALLTAGPYPSWASPAASRRIWIVTAISLLGIGLLRGSLDNMDPLVQTLGLSLIAVNYGALLMMLLAHINSGCRSVRWLSSRFLRAMGKYSYAMYLFHMPVGAFVRDRFYGPTDLATVFGSRLPGQMIFFALAGTLTFALALISWHAWEYPFLQLKKYFPLGPTRRASNEHRSAQAPLVA
jgi:peptidoglycan/LPS O-acetylase OafA/YrhL